MSAATARNSIPSRLLYLDRVSGRVELVSPVIHVDEHDGVVQIFAWAMPVSRLGEYQEIYHAWDNYLHHVIVLNQQSQLARGLGEFQQALLYAKQALDLYVNSYKLHAPIAYCNVGLALLALNSLDPNQTEAFEVALDTFPVPKAWQGHRAHASLSRLLHSKLEHQELAAKHFELACKCARECRLPSTHFLVVVIASYDVIGALTRHWKWVLDQPPAPSQHEE